MEKYQPSQAPDPEEWLALDELIRMDLVQTYHEMANIDLEGAETIHAVIHVTVENQLALGAEHVPETVAKLIRQGLGRHEAVHAIGAILSEDIYDIIKNNKEFDSKRYRSRLKKLTAKRWKKGKW